MQGYDGASDSSTPAPPIVALAPPEILEFNISSDVKAKVSHDDFI